MLPTLWGAGHQPPQQPDAPEPSVAQRQFLQEAQPPGSCPSCSSPARLQSQGLQGCVSKQPGCSVLLAQGIWPGRDTWPTSPHSQGIHGPLELSGKESRNQGKATLLYMPTK